MIEKQFMKIIEDANKIMFDTRSASDFLSYYEFVKFFENKSKISRNDFIIGCNFAYGWMPTILNFKNENEEEIDICVDLVNRAKENKALFVDFQITDTSFSMKKPLNNTTWNC